MSDEYGLHYIPCKNCKGKGCKDCKERGYLIEGENEKEATDGVA